MRTRRTGSPPCWRWCTRIRARPPPYAIRPRRPSCHVADSLSALPCSTWSLIRASGGRVADIGSGAGFPGLPLAIARPGVAFDLIESVRRKCEFMEGRGAAAGARPRQGCELARGGLGARRARGSSDAVLARALAPLAVLAEYAAPLLALGGRLIAWKGERDPAEERRGGGRRGRGTRPPAVQRGAPVSRRSRSPQSPPLREGEPYPA